MVAKILVVDDESWVAEMFCLMLERLGYETCLVSNGTDALVEINTFEPDVVLSDMRMPDMNGSELAREIKRILGDSVPVILTTGDVPSEKETRSFGVEGFIKKPFNSDELDELLQKVLNARKQ